MTYSVIPKTINVDNITIGKNINGEIEIKDNSKIMRSEVILDTVYTNISSDLFINFINQNKYKKIRVYATMKRTSGSTTFYLTSLLINNITSNYTYIYFKDDTQSYNNSYTGVYLGNFTSNGEETSLNLEIDANNKNMVSFKANIYNPYYYRTFMTGTLKITSPIYLNNITFQHLSSTSGQLDIKIIGYY
jgi:hypothetical protein